MPHFIKRLEVDKRFLNSYFNRIYTTDGIRYLISVVGKDKKTNMFHIVDKDGEWKILNPEYCPNGLKAWRRY
jgi:hypothetical protein